MVLIDISLMIEIIMMMMVMLALLLLLMMESVLYLKAFLFCSITLLVLESFIIVVVVVVVVVLVVVVDFIAAYHSLFGLSESLLSLQSLLEMEPLLCRLLQLLFFSLNLLNELGRNRDAGQKDFLLLWAEHGGNFSQREAGKARI